MMIERGDLNVVHEPFSYLTASGQFTFGPTTVSRLDDLFDLLLRHSGDQPLFFKETTDYSYDSLLADPRLFTGVTNTFLIRDPDSVVASYHALKPTMALEEVGFERLYRIFRAVSDATGEQPVVVDADDLIRAPDTVVEAYCRRVGLTFTTGSLRWSAGARTEWGLTDAWHRDVSASTGFVDAGRTYTTHPGNDAWLAEVAAYHRPFYEKMYACRIATDPPGVAPG